VGSIPAKRAILENEKPEYKLSKYRQDPNNIQQTI